MKIDENSLVGQLVVQDHRFATILDAYSIDYCCNGHKSLKEACNNQSIEPDEIIVQLNAVSGMQSNQNYDYVNWKLIKLIKHIEKVHHNYVEQKTIEIKKCLKKIASVHGSNHPELYTIQELFNQASDDLAIHMKKEELILFPYIIRLEKALEERQDLTSPAFGKIENPITQMEKDHNTEGDRFRKIEALTNKYRPPADACATFSRTYALLNEFQKDLHTHIHLENNILFPKSIQLEKQILNAQ